MQQVLASGCSAISRPKVEVDVQPTNRRGVGVRLNTLERSSLQIAFCSAADALFRMKQQDQSKACHDQKSFDHCRIVDWSVEIFSPAASAVTDQAVGFGEL